MTVCAEPGFEVWLSTNKDPKRKLAYTWELAINNQQQWIGINTHNANKLVVEGINQGVIVELVEYQELVSAASFIDPDYAVALSQARAVGVEIICYACTMSKEKIELNQVLNFIV